MNQTLLMRPLRCVISQVLDTSMPLDEAWVAQHVDWDGMTLLAQIRQRVRELGPADWAYLRDERVHVWRVLVETRRELGLA